MANLFTGTDGCATRISVASPILVIGAKSLRLKPGLREHMRVDAMVPSNRAAGCSRPARTARRGWCRCCRTPRPDSRPPPSAPIASTALQPRCDRTYRSPLRVRTAPPAIGLFGWSCACVTVGSKANAAAMTAVPATTAKRSIFSIFLFKVPYLLKTHQRAHLAERIERLRHARRRTLRLECGVGGAIASVAASSA